MSAHDQLRWRKSHRSGGANNGCVEVAPLDPGMAIRDSKHPQGGALRLTPTSWRTFVATVTHTR
jgi:hypothetical protein